ncbi:glucosaminidase domain-containing protein [Clostridium sp. LBM24168]
MNKRIKILISVLVFSFTLTQGNVGAAGLLDTSRVNIDSNKEWKVKFNKTLDPKTVNNSSIIVLDSDKNEKIPVSVTLGQDKQTVFISPKTSGYDPGKKYTLVIDKNIKSSSQTSMADSVKMDFEIARTYSNGTSYSGLPSIDSIEFQYLPLLSSQKQVFMLNSNNGQSVQYRIFVAKDNTYNQGPFEEITNGYTTPVDGKITAVKSLSAGTNGQKYKAIIYVRRSGATSGAHVDLNTDYDNYAVDYFRCVDSTDPQLQDDRYYKDYDISLIDAVNMELKLSPVFVETSVFNNAASFNQIKYYMNPDNFVDGYGKYQFLELSYSEGINASDLNKFLEDKNIFKGYGQTFIEAAKENDISVSYLVSHAMLETDNGKSDLANGGKKDINGHYIYGTPVYNFFGIGATDDDPIGNGTKKAYDEKWFTVEDGIRGGAKWIAQGYIDNPQYKQNTIYKMRWNVENPSHQYATDIAWAYKQISNIMKSVEMMSSSNEILDFEIPEYK